MHREWNRGFGSFLLKIPLMGMAAQKIAPFFKVNVRERRVFKLYFFIESSHVPKKGGGRICIPLPFGGGGGGRGERRGRGG